MTLCLLLAFAAIPLWGLPALAADEVFPSDPRIIQANSLLESESDWPTAIDLYEEVLAEDPDHLAARQWLARVLSWQGNYEAAFLHYDVLLARPDPPADASIERAEVLSWAGDYAEAEAEFESILAADPANERAAQGLVRVYLWSGNGAKSDAAYQRALAISAGEPSEDLLNLKAEISADLGTQAETDSTYFADSDGFRRFRVRVGGQREINRQTHLLASTAYTGVRSNGEGNDGVDVYAGIERRFGKRLRVNAQLGFRHWSRSADRVLFRGEGEFTASERLATGVQFHYDDFLEQSDSLEAILAGLTITAGRGWVWHEFNEAVSGYAYLDIGYVSDGNKRIGMGTSYTYRPWSHWDLSFRWLSDFLTYSERSGLYYDPVVDFRSAVSVLGQLSLPRGFHIDAGIDLGISYARDGGITGVGVAFGIEGGPTWTHRNGYFVSLRGRLARSQRATSYDSGGAWLTFGRDF